MSFPPTSSPLRKFDGVRGAYLENDDGNEF